MSSHFLQTPASARAVLPEEDFVTPEHRMVLLEPQLSPINAVPSPLPTPTRPPSIRQQSYLPQRNSTVKPSNRDIKRHLLRRNAIIRLLLIKRQYLERVLHCAVFRWKYNIFRLKVEGAFDSLMEERENERRCIAVDAFVRFMARKEREKRLATLSLWHQRAREFSLRQKRAEQGLRVAFLICNRSAMNLAFHKWLGLYHQSKDETLRLHEKRGNEAVRRALSIQMACYRLSRFSQKLSTRHLQQHFAAWKLVAWKAMERRKVFRMLIERIVFRNRAQKMLHRSFAHWQRLTSHISAEMRAKEYQDLINGQLHVELLHMEARARLSRFFAAWRSKREKYLLSKKLAAASKILQLDQRVSFRSLFRAWNTWCAFVKKPGKYCGERTPMKAMKEETVIPSAFLSFSSPMPTPTTSGRSKKNLQTITPSAIPRPRGFTPGSRLERERESLQLQESPIVRRLSVSRMDVEEEVLRSLTASLPNEKSPEKVSDDGLHQRRVTALSKILGRRLCFSKICVSLPDVNAKRTRKQRRPLMTSPGSETPLPSPTTTDRKLIRALYQEGSASALAIATTYQRRLELGRAMAQWKMVILSICFERKLQMSDIQIRSLVNSRRGTAIIASCKLYLSLWRRYTLTMSHAFHSWKSRVSESATSSANDSNVPNTYESSDEARRLQRKVLLLGVCLHWQRRNYHNVLAQAQDDAEMNHFLVQRRTISSFLILKIFSRLLFSRKFRHWRTVVQWEKAESVPILNASESSALSSTPNAPHPMQEERTASESSALLSGDKRQVLIVGLVGKQLEDEEQREAARAFASSSRLARTPVNASQQKSVSASTTGIVTRGGKRKPVGMPPSMSTSRKPLPKKKQSTPTLSVMNRDPSKSQEDLPAVGKGGMSGLTATPRLTQSTNKANTEEKRLCSHSDSRRTPRLVLVPEDMSSSDTNEEDAAEVEDATQLIEEIKENHPIAVHALLGAQRLYLFLKYRRASQAHEELAGAFRRWHRRYRLYPVALGKCFRVQERKKLRASMFKWKVYMEERRVVERLQTVVEAVKHNLMLVYRQKEGKHLPHSSSTSPYEALIASESDKENTASQKSFSFNIGESMLEEDERYVTAMDPLALLNSSFYRS